MSNESSSGARDQELEAKRAASWRGRRGKQSRAIRYRWQKDWTMQPLERLRVRENWRRTRIVVLLAAGLALLVMFVVWLMFDPQRTPLISVSAPAYEHPFPPLKWSAEDHAVLGGLDGNTLDVFDISDRWRTAQRALDSLNEQLEGLASSRPRNPALVVYITMHGAVDDHGNACLIPPGATPLRSETWLRVIDVLRTIGNADFERTRVLVVFDTPRMQHEWALGVTYNGFADALDAAVAQANVRDLAVICGAAPGQISHTSDVLQRSAFGDAFARGLAGSADRNEVTGDSDGRVSLHELADYLRLMVDRWSMHHRGQHQTPVLLPRHVDDFDIAWTQSGDSPIATESFESSVPRERIASLWESLDRLRAADPLLYDPINWRDLEQSLLWLDAAVDSGSAYEDSARRVYADLRSRTNEMLNRASNARDVGSVVDSSVVFSGAPPLRAEPWSAHSMPQGQFWAQRTADQNKRTRAAMAPFFENPSRQTAEGLLESLAGDVDAQSYVEPYLLHLFHTRAPSASWETPRHVATAIRLSDQLERIAVPRDVRIQYWLRPHFEMTDQLRRSAMDLLFVGQSESVDAAEEKLDELQRATGQLQELSTKANEAFAILDQAFAQLPYYGMWLASAATNDQTSSDASMVNENLLPLIDDAHRLARILDTPPKSAEATVVSAPPFAPAVSSVREHLVALREKFDLETERLTALRKPVPSAVEEYDSLLGTPFLASDQRDQLTNKRRLLETTLADSWDGQLAQGAESKEPAVPDESPSQLEREYLVWRKHPAWQMIRPEHWTDVADATGTTSPPREGPLTEVAVAYGSFIRGRLFALESTIRRMQDAVATADSTSSSKSDSHTNHLGWLQAAHLARAAAGLWFPSLDDDPVRQLRHHDIACLLMWHADRTLADFWGPVDQDAPPFFELASADYLEGARGLAAEDGTLTARIAQLERLAAARIGASVGGLEVRADDLLLIDADEQLETEIEIQPRVDSQALPVGNAAVFIRGANGRLPGSSDTLRFPLPKNNAAATVRVPCDVRGDAATRQGAFLDAVAFLRGNEYRATFALRPSRGVEVDVTRPPVTPTTITLSGSERKQASIYFVLDCSNSMADLTTVEAPGGTREIPRLDAAKTALSTMLDQLAADGNARVGVRFYGHRVGWNTQLPSQLLEQTNYARPIPAELLPSEDVESVLALGRFDTVVAGGIRTLLNSVEPWGESPLYLALSESLADFANEEAGTEKSIVVVTDGTNYQFNSPNPVSRADVVSAWNTVQVPIYIVGFDVPQEEAVEASQQLTQLAESTGGSYVTAANATALLETLQQLLGPTDYRVYDSAGDEIMTAAVGTTVEVPATYAPQQTLTVAVESLAEQIEVDGGEALDLIVGEGGRTIESRRYTRSDPIFAPLMVGQPGDESEFLVGLHRPVVEASGVRFDVSVQNRFGRVVPRPATAWIEIDPASDDATQSFSPYVLYDAVYENQTPVPLVRRVAQNWPSSATHANVRAWFSWQQVPPTWVRSVAEALDANIRADAPTAGWSNDATPGVTFQLNARRGAAPGDPYRIGIIERHGPTSMGIDSLRLDIQPPADRVVRRFDDENQIVTHTFFFARADDSTIRRYEVHATRASDLKSAAYYLETPVRLEINSAGLLLVPTE